MVCLDLFHLPPTKRVKYSVLATVRNYSYLTAFAASSAETELAAAATKTSALLFAALLPAPPLLLVADWTDKSCKSVVMIPEVLDVRASMPNLKIQMHFLVDVVADNG